MKKILFFTVLFLTLSFTANAQRKQVFPVDEAYKDPSFKKFRDKLIAATRRRDVKYILSITDKNIKIGFGGDDGIEAFKKQWKLNSPKSEFWKEFLSVITHGGNFQKDDKNTFWSPYTYLNFPPDLDADGLIIERRADLKAKPSSASKTIAVLSYDAVKILPPYRKGWQYVQRLDGIKGWVKSDYLNSSYDYRAAFTKTKGRWKLDFFVSGD